VGNRTPALCAELQKIIQPSNTAPIASIPEIIPHCAKILCPGMTDATASHINWARLLKQCHTELGISTYPRVSITSNRRPDAEAAVSFYYV
jgi:hypothetical protein